MDVALLQKHLINFFHDKDQLNIAVATVSNGLNVNDGGKHRSTQFGGDCGLILTSVMCDGRSNLLQGFKHLSTPWSNCMYCDVDELSLLGRYVCN